MLNQNAAEEFLNALDPLGHFTFQTFDDTPAKRRELAQIIQCPLREKWGISSAVMQSLNDRGAGVFVTVNQTDGKGRAIHNITEIRALFVDGDDIPTPAEWHLPPSIIVRRDATHWHAYWLIGPFDLQPAEMAGTFKTCQKRLAAHYGSDPKICDLPRVMRIPGYYHRKGEPTMVVLEKCDRNVFYQLSDIMAGVAELPKAITNEQQRQQHGRSASTGVASNVVERARKFLTKTAPAVSGQSGHDHTFHVAACLVHGFELSRGDALPLFQGWNACCQPPWSDKDIERKLDQAIKKGPSTQFPSGWLLNAQNPKFSPSPLARRGATEMGSNGAITIYELPIMNEEPATVIEGDYEFINKPLAPLPLARRNEEERIDLASVNLAPAVPNGDAAQWFNAEFGVQLNSLCAMSGTAQDNAATVLFGELANRLPGVSVLTKERVKKEVCERMSLGVRAYDKALIEATTRLRSRVDTGLIAQAEKYVQSLWNGPSTGSGNGSSRVLRYWREEWYEWTREQGCYRIRSKDSVRGAAILWLNGQGVNPTCSATADFMSALAAISPIENSIDENTWLRNKPVLAAGADTPIYLSLRNGILNLCDREELLQHTPDYFSLMSLPFAYDPIATCPKWLEATLVWQPLDATGAAYQILQDWMGYIFVPYNPNKKFLICTGPGDDGKSVYARICREIVGRENCDSVPLEMFDPSINGGLQSLLGKSLNIIGDANMVERVAEGTLKSLTGNDVVTISRKYLSSVTTVWPGKIMIAANSTPYWRDRSNAVFNRMLPLHWTTIPADKMNVNLVDELVAGELPGIFNWAMDGFDRIRKNPFNRAGQVGEWVEEARSETQAELDFFETHMAVDVDVHCNRNIYCGDLMNAYKQHCEQANQKAFCNEITLGRQLREWIRRKFKADCIADDKARVFFERMRARDGSAVGATCKRRTYYRGVWLRE